jgi:hypothetical protein
VSGAATPEEAAAIAAAIERFRHETAPAPALARSPDTWTRVAMLEGVSRGEHPPVSHPWINT